MFTMKDGERYICQNRSCRAQVLVVSNSTEGASNPRCCCGAEMKKPYAKPTVRKLDKDEAEAFLAKDSVN